MSGGWKTFNLNFQGDQTAAITTADIQATHVYGFLPFNACNRTFRFDWKTVPLPYGPTPPPDPFVAGATTWMNAYHAGATVSDWSLRAGTFSATDNKTTFSGAVYAAAEAPQPYLTHGEVNTFAQTFTRASIGGQVVYNQAGSMDMLGNPLPRWVPTGVSSSWWCELDLAANANLADSFTSDISVTFNSDAYCTLSTRVLAQNLSSVHIADGDGILMSSPNGGLASCFFSITDPNNHGNDLLYSAQLENGVFSAGGGLASLPWVFTYDGPKVVQAFIAASDAYQLSWQGQTLPAGTYDFNIDAQATATDNASIPVPEPTTLVAGLLLLLPLGASALRQLRNNRRQG